MSDAYAGACGRECLEGFVEGCLEALVASDAGRLPASRDLRFTENGRPLPPGRGLWRTVRGREPGGHCFADPEAGQVEWWGVVREVAGPAMLSLRLRVEDRLVREVETLVVRQRPSLFSPEGLLAPRPRYQETVPPAERLRRTELVRIANRYFEAIERDDGSLVPVLDEVTRIENGVQTTLNPRSELPVGRLGVREQMDTGYTRHIAAARDRRFPVVDEERGLVLVHFLFDHPGNLESVGGRVPFGYPNSMMCTEVFRIRDGHIHNIEALLEVFPYGWSPGWEAPARESAPAGR
jgi:hypothetical protein